MAAWWHVRKYSTEIIPIEVIKETPKQLTVIKTWMGSRKEYRVAKFSEYDNYFEHWKDAHDFLIRRYTSSVEGLEEKLLTARENLQAVKAMRPPEVGPSAPVEEGAAE